MTDTPGDAKREELREKIEAAEARNEERTFGDMAREARDSATGFVKEHPIATVAGVAAIGLAIGAMTRPGRRVGSRVGKRGAALAAMAAEFGMSYAREVLELAEGAAATGKDKLEDLGDSIGESARGLRRDAAYYADSTTDKARSFGRRAGKKAGRAMRDLRARSTH